MPANPRSNLIYIICHPRIPPLPSPNSRFCSSSPSDSHGECDGGRKQHRLCRGRLRTYTTMAQGVIEALQCHGFSLPQSGSKTLKRCSPTSHGTLNHLPHITTQWTLRSKVRSVSLSLSILDSDLQPVYACLAITLTSGTAPW